MSEAYAEAAKTVIDVIDLPFVSRVTYEDGAYECFDLNHPGLREAIAYLKRFQ